MAVDAQNPNEQWWAEFNYRFNLSGQQTPLRNGYLMPGSAITLTEIGFRPRERGGTAAQLEVENIRWHRVDPNVVGSRYADYALQRFNVAFENAVTKTGGQVGTQSSGRTSFDVVNRGSFGYWAMDLVVKLYRGSSVVAINKLVFDKCRARRNASYRHRLVWKTSVNQPDRDYSDYQFVRSECLSSDRVF